MIERLLVICFLKKCLPDLCVSAALDNGGLLWSLQQTHFQSPDFCGFMLASWFKQQLPESNGFQHCELEGLLDILQAYIILTTKLKMMVSKEEKFSNSQIMLLISPTPIIFNTCILPWFLHLGKVIYGMKTRLVSNISCVPLNKSKWENGCESTL